MAEAANDATVFSSCISFFCIDTTWVLLLLDQPGLDESESMFIQEDEEDIIGEGSLQEEIFTG